MRVNNSHSGVSMRLLLLNNNPAVSRLIKLSAEKAGYELDEFEDYGLVPLVTYDVILVDNELYEETDVAALCEQVDCNYVVYICQRGSKKPETVNVSLEKPFLPTDFLVLMDKIKNVLTSHKTEAVDDAEASIDKTVLKKVEAFDIDTLAGEDDDMLPINLLEENEDDFEDDENDKKFTFNDLELDTLDLESDLLEDEGLEEKELISNEDVFSFDDIEPLEKEAVKSLEDFDFDENKNDLLDTLDADEHLIEEEHTPSVLDKDEIDELKQLLDENDDDDEKEIVELSLDANGQEEEDIGTFFFDENEKTEETSLKDTSEIEFDDMGDLNFEETVLAKNEEMLAPLEEENSSLEDAQEEMTGDFSEAIDVENEEKSEEVNEEILEEEESLPNVDIAVNYLDEMDAIDSLDDLSENMLKQAFGEDINEEDINTSIAAATSKSQEIEVIRDELESSIARSISSLAQSDILREALKGMRLNISITFDEKE